MLALLAYDLCLTSSVEHNQRIYAEDKEGLWAIQGRFNDALKNAQALNWVADSHGLLLRLLTDKEPSLPLPQPLATLAAAPATSTSSSNTRTGVARRAQGQQLTRDELILELQIPVHLTDRRDADLHLAYQRWKANQTALNVLAERLANGTWPGARPTEQQVYECFISKSMWFLYYRKHFLNITKYPDMVLWLDEDPTAPSNFDLWGL